MTCWLEKYNIAYIVLSNKDCRKLYIKNKGDLLMQKETECKNELFESWGGKGSQGIEADSRHMELRNKLLRLFQDRPMVDSQLLTNLGLYARSSVLATIFFRQEVYKRILDIPGDIFVFGLWWGQDIILFENLRAVYEPYNFNRKIVGFDTFIGYPEDDIGENDVSSNIIRAGSYAVPNGYEIYLEQLAKYHINENSSYHPNKITLIKGDVIKTVPEYYQNHPESVTALAYFDMALYGPTKVCMEQVLKTCVKGSVIVLDEFNREEYPGETIALKELVDLSRVKIEKSNVLPDRAFMIVE